MPVIPEISHSTGRLSGASNEGTSTSASSRSGDSRVVGARRGSPVRATRDGATARSTSAARGGVSGVGRANTLASDPTGSTSHPGSAPSRTSSSRDGSGGPPGAAHHVTCRPSGPTATPTASRRRRSPKRRHSSTSDEEPRMADGSLTRSTLPPDGARVGSLDAAKATASLPLRTRHASVPAGWAPRPIGGSLDPSGRPRRRRTGDRIGEPGVAGHSHPRCRALQASSSLPVRAVRTRGRRRSVPCPTPPAPVRTTGCRPMDLGMSSAGTASGLSAAAASRTQPPGGSEDVGVRGDSAGPGSARSRIWATSSTRISPPFALAPSSSMIRQ